MVQLVKRLAWLQIQQLDKLKLGAELFTVTT